MATKWSAFTAGSAIASANELVGLQSSVNVRWTFTQLSTYMAGTGLAGTSQVLFPVGSAAAPGWAFTGATGHGAYFENNLVNFAASGVQVMALQGTGTPTVYFTGLAVPSADGGGSLGSTALGWQNLFGNTGFVLNIENGNWVATHTSAILTVGTGDLRVTTAGTDTASVVTVGGTQTLTNKTLTAPAIGAATGTSLSVTGGLTSRNALAIPAAASAVTALNFSSTALFGVFFGSGDPNTALTAAKGSLYLRSDGGGVADRAYINTNGTTAWTAIATAG